MTKICRKYWFLWQKTVDFGLKRLESKWPISAENGFFRAKIWSDTWSFLRRSESTVNPFLLSLDNFSCFNKVELIRLIRFFEFCSSRVAAASVWPRILENILKILLVIENIGEMICDFLQGERNVSFYLYTKHEWPPGWCMIYESYSMTFFNHIDGAMHI